MKKKDLKNYILKAQKQRELIENSILTFCDARKEMSSFQLYDMVEEMKHFNKKVINGIVEYTSDMVLACENAKFGLTTAKIKK